MHDYGYYHHDGTPVLAWLFFVAFVVLIALGAYALFRAWRTPTPVAAATPPAAGGEALAVLRLRYARGEVSREEFLQASADLGGDPPPPGTA